MKVFLLNIIRSIKYGFQNFGRNVFLSIATTSIMVLTLFGLGFFMVINQISTEALRNIQEKVDISVYIKDAATEAEAQALKEYVDDLPEVSNSELISKEQALDIYRQRFEDNPALIKSLQFLDANPLPVTLTIQATDSKHYNTIWEKIQQYQNFENTVADSDYAKDSSRNIITRLNSIISTTKAVGLAVIVVLAIIAVLITYNTVRLTMYSYRNEIEIMRLVGASDAQIKGPFLVEGILFGVFGTCISVLILFAVVLAISDPVSKFAMGGQTTLTRYLLQDIELIVGVTLAVGITLGVGSSWFAINRYLKV